ncbi:benzoate 4-monooxygenase cytochrome P450 [Aspergillus karnatakaensis]|uniref:cytochrome P450 n=1 Tax=Aspergillus karnatakaensis TaxID=1810916 RepID=UPI003CCDCD6A
MFLWVALAATVCWLYIAPFVIYLYDAKRLRQYPNQNFLSGLTSLAYVYERRKTFRTRDLLSQHRKHPILRTAPNAISFGSVDAIKDIYGHGSPCRKGDEYKLIQGDRPHVLNVIDRDDHTRKRRMLSNAFATKNLETWEFKIADKVKKLVTQFDRRCTEPVSHGVTIAADDLNVNFRFWSNLFTLDAIADIALSEPLGFLESGSDLIELTTAGGTGRENLNMISSLQCGSRMISRFVSATDWFHALKLLAKILSPTFCAHGGDFGGIVSNLAGRRLAKAQDKNNKLDDFLSCLNEDKKGTNRRLELKEIEAETNVLLDAGSDTTAIALTNVLYYLIKHPSTLAKLRDEIASALNECEVIAPYAKVKSLPYLKACLDESLRLSPPVPRGLERKTPPGGMEIMGHQIAGNITVSVPAYVAHRDEGLFPDPEAYNPDRWLSSPPELSKRMRAAWIPFTAGARACLGRNITMMEQQILIATLVHRYEFELPSSDWELEWEEAFNLWPSQMPLKIWRRDAASVTG